MRSRPPSEELRTATLQVVVPVCIRQASFCMCDTSVWMVSFGIVNRLIGLSMKVLKRSYLRLANANSLSGLFQYVCKNSSTNLPRLNL